ncbi:hypothetical protein ACTXT7_014084 [Hymenolepis weldensis]
MCIEIPHEKALLISTQASSFGGFLMLIFYLLNMAFEAQSDPGRVPLVLGCAVPSLADSESQTMIPNAWSPTWNSKNASLIGFSSNSKDETVHRFIRKETLEYDLSDGGGPESQNVQFCVASMLVVYILVSASPAKVMFHFPRSQISI